MTGEGKALSRHFKQLYKGYLYVYYEKQTLQCGIPFGIILHNEKGRCYHAALYEHNGAGGGLLFFSFYFSRLTGLGAGIFLGNLC